MTHLVFDVGNSRIKAAVIREREIIRRQVLEHGAAKGSAQFQDAIDALRAGINIERIGIATVVPEKVSELRALLREDGDTEPLIVDASVNLPFRLSYHTPETLGADRIAAASAAWTIFGEPAGRSVVSIDAGTATTYEVVAEGVFLGGAIAPGPRVMSSALGAAAAQLPMVDVGTDSPQVIGRSTHEAIQAGVLFGYIDAVNGMLRRITDALPDDPAIVLTGGWAELLHPQIDFPHERDPDLVLRGVDILLHLNP